MTANHALFQSNRMTKPYIIPIIDIDSTRVGLVIKKIEQFNDIIKLVANRPSIYNVTNFIQNIEQPHLHHILRKDVIVTLQIIFDLPQKVWTHENPEVIKTIEAIKDYFISFRATKALLFESSSGQFDWQQIMQDKSTVPFYFFECMHIFFGIQCYIPNTGSLMHQESLVTANLTNHGSHFSIGTHYLLTPSDGNCFFHLHCQFIAAVCLKHTSQQTQLDQLLDLSYTHAINLKNDQLLRFFYNIKTKTQLQQLLQALFEANIKDFETLKKPNMLDLSAHLVANLFKIKIREHHINTSGETFLKKTHGAQNTDWFIDVFVSNDTSYVSHETLGQWHAINSYKDYLTAIACLWYPTIKGMQPLKSSLQK